MRILYPLLLSTILPLAAVAQPDQPSADLATLAAKVKTFRVLDLPPSGDVELATGQSLTIEQLRGVPLDDDPPVLGKPAKPYDPRMTDDFAPGAAPYVARDIQPFRFRYFNNEFNYGGWYNWGMTDYASAHGFNILSAYNHKPEDWTHVPAGTKWLAWGGYVDWDQWPQKHGIAPGRFDKLDAIDVTDQLTREGVFKPEPAFAQIMIDMEHGVRSPEDLRKQDWYPKDANEADRKAFEQRYYAGYAKTYVGPVEAARRAGFRGISLYGWEPFGRRWYGLEAAKLDPATDWAWNAFGRQIYDAVDILNPSVYCFYWSPQNVAYTLANIDLNMKLINSMPVRKPMRPYYWTLLHGGGGGWRWWTEKPIANEDARAMIAMLFFTGCDGFDLWNWSGTGSHHLPPALKADADVILARGFELLPDRATKDAKPTHFERYDALHIKSLGKDGIVRFQRIEQDNWSQNYGIADDRPFYTMPQRDLTSCLRVASDPVSAVIEGMALAKPFEALLHAGEVKVDVPSQEQFAKTLPIVRRVKCGPYHVLVTYDPAWAKNPEPRKIVLDKFDAHPGLKLTLPADAQTRIFVLREA